MSLRPLGEAIAAWEPGRPAREDPLYAIVGLWPGLVGARVAEHAAPLELRGGTLVIATKSSAWSQQLQFLTETILAGVRARPEGRGVERLAFRSGAFRTALAAGRVPGRPSARPTRARVAPEGEPPAVDAADALARLRRRISRLAAGAVGARCVRCGAGVAPEAQARCAPCAGIVATERALALKRLLFAAPWLGEADLREHLADLRPRDVENARRELLARWWAILERVRLSARPPTSYERQIASSYLLLQSRLPPERLSTAVIRNVLGAELEGKLWGTGARAANETVR